MKKEIRNEITKRGKRDEREEERIKQRNGRRKVIGKRMQIKGLINEARNNRMTVWRRRNGDEKKAINKETRG